MTDIFHIHKSIGLNCNLMRIKIMTNFVIGKHGNSCCSLRANRDTDRIFWDFDSKRRFNTSSNITYIRIIFLYIVYINLNNR